MLKKLTTLALSLMFIVGAASTSFATSNADLFDFDEVMVDAQFSALNSLENVLSANPEADYNYVAANHAQAIAEANFQASNVTPILPGSPLSKDEPALGISGYIWGACLGIIGVLAVYILLDNTNEEFRKAETKKALIGCVGSYAVLAILYFVGLGTALGLGTI